MNTEQWDPIVVDTADTNTRLPLPPEVKNLYAAQQALARHYADTGLKFTLDGRLVGDIAEAVAFEYFDLKPPQKRTGGVDALTQAGRTVQIKATGKPKSGPAFTPGKGIADYLLFFVLDFREGTATVVYNGPEAPVRKLLPPGFSGTHRVKLKDIEALAAKVGRNDAIPLMRRNAASSAVLP